MPRRYPALQSPDWLQHQYHTECRTIAEMAALLGCPALTVIRALQRHEIETRTPQESAQLRGTQRTRRFPQLADAAWLRQQYEEHGRTYEEIAVLLGCTNGLVSRAMKTQGIVGRQRGRTRPMKPRLDAIPQLQDHDWLQQQYIEKNRPLVEIAQELGCKANTVAKALWRHEIRRRSSIPPARKRDSGRYIWTWSPDHPNANRGGYVAEHRLVVEREIGRYLEREEQVHHVNEQKDDNRLGNLLVFPNGRFHTMFHHNPPDWVPRCEHCGHPCPERLEGRPSFVPLLMVPATG